MSVALSRRALLRGSAAVTAGLCASLLCNERATAIIFPGGQTAVIANTKGDSVRLRGTPSTTGDVRGNIGEGAIVLITDGPKSDSGGDSWYQVQYAGQSGWVMADYISARKLTGYAAVTFTDGDGLRLRDNSDANAKVVGQVPEGAVVQILGGPKLQADGTPWYQVNHAGKQGYLMGTYLAPREAPPATATATANATATATATKTANSTTTATATATANTATATKTANSTVTATAGTGTTATATAAKTTAEANVLKAPDVARDERVKVVNTNGGGVRMRDEVGFDTDILDTIDEGTVVTVIASIRKDSKGNEWVPVSFDGTKGYVMGVYLAKTSDAATKRTPLPPAPTGSGASTSTATTSTATASTAASTSTTPGATGTPAAAAAPTPDSGAGSATGAKIVAEAMKYVGSRYVPGGTGPSVFDCSGFTMFAVKQATGMGISRAVGGQAGAGQFVPKENLQPGDLVIYANTWTSGLSHVGIYIGNNRFVHAENQNTGVCVSDTNSNYYSSRYYTARRLS